VSAKFSGFGEATKAIPTLAAFPEQVAPVMPNLFQSAVKLLVDKT
jgi:hypothetical protein